MCKDIYQKMLENSHLKKFLKKQLSKAKQLEAVKQYGSGISRGKQDGFSIQYIHNPDKDVQLEAVKQDGFNIQFIHNPDKDVQLAAVKRDGYSIKHIRNPGKDVQLEAIKQSGYSIRYIHNPDKDVQLEAVKQNGFNIQNIRNPDKDVQLAAVKQDGSSIIFCPELFSELLVAYLSSKECPEGLKQEICDPNFDLQNLLKIRESYE